MEMLKKAESMSTVSQSMNVLVEMAWREIKDNAVKNWLHADTYKLSGRQEEDEGREVGGEIIEISNAKPGVEEQERNDDGHRYP